MAATRNNPTTARRREQVVPALGAPITVRIELSNQPGTLTKVTATIGEHGGNLGAIDIVDITADKVVRDITFTCDSESQAEAIVRELHRLRGIRVRQASDPVLLAHLGGKIELRSRVPLKTRQDLSVAYTPGVGRVSMHVYHHPETVWNLTSKRNTVAVVTDGTAVLGLGAIGPAAALPVMEGKAVLFKEFADIDAWPLCLDTTNPAEIAATVRHIAPGFGGINLEDISAPRCFEVERLLKDELDIPVFHDDQHGTAVVVTAALLNALRIVGKDFSNIKVALLGVGAAGMSVARMLISQGVRNITGCDLHGIVYRGRTVGMFPELEWFAEHSNPDNIQGGIADALVDADVFIGLSGRGLVTAEDISRMGSDPIVFAMANPVAEVMPHEIQGIARIIATGRSDYPNQINNVLCFPGLFRGALDVRAREINETMKMAAATAIASAISRRRLQEDYIIPSVFNRAVVPAVAKAVARAARATGVARRGRRSFK